MVETILRVDGMMCGMCESHINDVVRKTARVNKVTSSHTKGETVILSEQPVDVEALKAAIAETGYTVTGQTYEELAKAMGVDEAAFAETMKTWNGYVEAKNDPDFGRTSFAKALDTAPYYAIKVTAGVHHTMGGLKINTNTEVLKADGSVIPGLFAAGEVTGGVHGANRLGGNAVADFTVFGRIAGAAASKYAA